MNLFKIAGFILFHENSLGNHSLLLPLVEKYFYIPQTYTLKLYHLIQDLKLNSIVVAQYPKTYSDPNLKIPKFGRF